MVSQWQRGAIKGGIGAYADWLCGPGGKYPPEYVQKSMLVCLAAGKTLKEFKSRCDQLKRERPGIEVPLLVGHDELEHFTSLAHADFCTLLGEHQPLRECIQHIVIAQKLPDDAICDDHHASAYTIPPQATGKAAHRKLAPERGIVVIGVIEEGVAIANQRFRRADCNSRVEYAWLQDGRCTGYVQGFGYGRELRKEDRKDANGKVLEKGIDTLLRDCTRGTQVNEDLFYAKAGLADFGRPGHKAVALRASHGALVMDLACGYDQGTSPVGSNGLDQRPIVCVQLPTLTIADTSGLGLECYMLDGLHYILQRAKMIAASRGCGPLPVVVNFSSGVLAGPHDGTHPIERAIDQIIECRRRVAPTEVVLPTGNSYLSRIHFSIPPKRHGEVGEKQLHWKILPDDRTCTYLEIWLPRRQQPDDELEVDLVLKPPGGEPSPPLANTVTDGTVTWRPRGQDAVCKAYFEYFGPPTNRGRYLLALLPTTCLEALTKRGKTPGPLTPCGTWTIVLRNKKGQPIEGVDGWIQWDDRPLGYPRSGRQSYFLDETYERFDKISGRIAEIDNASPIKRAGTISAIATGTKTVVVGGLKQKEMTAVEYSGAGPHPPPANLGTDRRTGPDAVVVSDDSSIHQGILAAGTRSRSMVAPNGTSVAAPQITRELADRFAQGDCRSGQEIVRALALDQERQRPATPPPPDRARGGWGRIVLPRNASRVGNKRIEK
jgi:hypothetical protein